MSPAIHKRKLENIRSLLLRFDDSQMERINTVEVCAAIQDIELALKMKRSVVVNRKRVKAKKAETRSEWEQIRDAVIDRALGRCECGCGAEANTAYGHGLEVDHMFGGSDRKTLQSIYTCWALIPQHHLWKTRNEFPGRAGWLKAFINNCELMHAISHDAGYAHAASIAQKKLDSLTIQGRAE